MTIIRNGRLDLTRLHALEAPPELFAPGDLVFWTDPYISAHVLEAHLDPESDDASRRQETISAAVDHIASICDPASYPRLLDLGCGPGLYCSEFFDAGYTVTGIDYSAVSIEYARNEARRTGRGIRYRELDYREWEPEEGEFDCIVMIFGDFCVLAPSERDAMLAKIRRALRPGGCFIFDIFTELYLPHPDDRAWYTMLEEGFWHEGANLVLEIKHRYQAESVHLNRYLVVTEDGRVRCANIWHRWYERAEIRALLESAGFRVDGMWADLTGTPLSPSPEWVGIAARRTDFGAD